MTKTPTGKKIAAAQYREKTHEAVAKQLRNGIFGTSAEIHSLCDIFQITIIIYFEKNGGALPPNEVHFVKETHHPHLAHPTNSAKRIIRLLHTNQGANNAHFDLLIPTVKNLLDEELDRDTETLNRHQSTKQTHTCDRQVVSLGPSPCGIKPMDYILKTLELTQMHTAKSPDCFYKALEGALSDYYKGTNHLVMTAPEIREKVVNHFKTTPNGVQVAIENYPDDTLTHVNAQLSQHTHATIAEVIVAANCLNITIQLMYHDPQGERTPEDLKYTQESYGPQMVVGTPPVITLIYANPSQPAPPPL
jgi:hypothetical protein